MNLKNIIVTIYLVFVSCIAMWFVKSEQNHIPYKTQSYNVGSWIQNSFSGWITSSGSEQEEKITSTTYSSETQRIIQRSRMMLIPFKPELAPKCIYNWKEYERPSYGICSDKPWHAWECIEWYEEYNNQCEKSYRSGNGKCLIKWNISFKTGEKIYHLPEDSYYQSTVINSQYWERYFCTEKSAESYWFRGSRY